MQKQSNYVQHFNKILTSSQFGAQNDHQLNQYESNSYHHAKASFAALKKPLPVQKRKKCLKGKAS
jgi:hypothetical protein